jgi:hypothetical protein
MTWVDDLKTKEWQLYSQHGEDGISLTILPHLCRRGVALEIGAGNGDQNNTRILSDVCGWLCYCFDGKWGNERVNKVHVTRDNMKDVVKWAKFGGNDPFDVVSIDVDGVDWWLWKAFLETGARPGLCILEYNGAVRGDVAVTVPYSDNFQWDGTDYHGASLLAFEMLGLQYAYRLVYCESSGTNAFFVHEKCLKGIEAPKLHDLYRRRHVEFGWRPDLPWQYVFSELGTSELRPFTRQEIGAFA